MQPRASCPYPSFPPPVDIPLVTLPSRECSYLPGRFATDRAFRIERLSPDLYHQFMNAGFRRSGNIVYQPICSGCRACQQFRIPVAGFSPSKSQRRCARRNQDLHISESDPLCTDEKFDLYRRYARDWHHADLSKPQHDRDLFEAFLYNSPVDTIEFSYRDASGRLLAVAICDHCDQSLSSVYFFFDPAESSRSLGTFGVLTELAWARSAGIPYYYLGFLVRGCAAMEYKANFGPHQILSPDGQWGDPNAAL